MTKEEKKLLIKQLYAQHDIVEMDLPDDIELAVMEEYAQQSAQENYKNALLFLDLDGEKFPGDGLISTTERNLDQALNIAAGPTKKK